MCDLKNGCSVAHWCLRARAHQHHTRICTLTSSHSVEQLRIYDNHARTHHIPILITTTGSVHSWYLRKLSLICFGPIFFSLCATPAPFAERTLSFTILSTQNLHRIFVARLTCIIMLIMGDNDGKPCSFRHTERMRMDNHKDKRKRGKRFIFTEIVSAANCSNRKFEISSKRDETREKEKTKHIRFIVFYFFFFLFCFIIFLFRIVICMCARVSSTGRAWVDIIGRKKIAIVCGFAADWIQRHYTHSHTYPIATVTMPIWLAAAAACGLLIVPDKNID